MRDSARAANLAGKTYEVQTSDGVRWTVADIHETRSAAIEKADALLETNKFYAVQVIVDCDRAGTEVVYEKEAEYPPERKVLNISPIEEAHFCKDFTDFCGFEARCTVGRLMRQYLDEYGLSALELAFDAAHLTMLERNDKIFPTAAQRVAQLQAKAANTNPADRADQLYNAVAQMKDYAKAAAHADLMAATLKEGGLDAAIQTACLSVPKDERNIAVRFGLARLLASVGDWNQKFEKLTDLAVEGLWEAATGFLDEAMSELADAASAMMELLGGQADLGSANRTIAMLAVGRCPAPKNPISCIEAVNGVLARHKLPLTRRMLYERLAAAVGGTRPLTREGRDKDRDMFVTLTRDLIELAGLEGGPPVTEAMTRRACIVLSPGEENLSLEAAVGRMLDLLPHRAVRMGFLLDLVVSPLGQENQGAIFQTLGRLVQQLTTVASFLPSGTTPEMRERTLASLKRRLTAEGLPKAWREGISQALDGLADSAPSKPALDDAEPYFLDEEIKRIIAMSPDPGKFAAGEVLFNEGEAGETAYLIRTGEVEILHKIGNEEHVLARLGRGEIFGEMSLIDNQPRMATARVAKEAELAVISRENIQSRLGRLEASDMVLRRLIDVFVTRIRGEARSYE